MNMNELLELIDLHYYHLRICIIKILGAKSIFLNAAQTSWLWCLITYKLKHTNVNIQAENIALIGC